MKKLFIIGLVILSLCVKTNFVLADEDKFKVTLNEATQMALEGNIELQEQRKNLGIAQNDIKIANALKNPSFQSNLLMGQVTRGNASQVGAMIPIEVGKRGARKKSAIAQSVYVDNKIKDSEFKLKLRIRTAYFNLLQAKSELKIMEDRRDLLEDMLDAAKTKAKKSEDYHIDVLQADMKVKKQYIQINKAKANVRTAQYNFNRILNLENNLTLYDTKEDSLFDKSFVTALNVPNCQELENIAFSSRYDIKMAEAKILKAKRDIDVAIRRRIPDVNLGGGYSFQTAQQTGSAAVPGAYVGVGVELPVLYFYSPEIRNAKLNYEKTQLEYNSILNITKNIIHTNYDKFTIAGENVKHYNAILAESAEILKLSRQKYKKGKMAITTLIVIEHGHQELLSEYISAIGVYYNAYLALLQEVGMDKFKDVSNL